MPRPNKHDPTRTTVLRNRFVRSSNKRFRKLRGSIKGYYENKALLGEQFTFERDEDKVNEFMDWLSKAVQDNILDVRTLSQGGRNLLQDAWYNLYITDSYERGVTRARYELRKAKYDVPPLNETGGITASMSTPFHADRLGLLYTRTFNELKGITDAMSQQISRVLTKGIADGKNPRVLARQLNKVISGIGEDLGITDALGRYIPAQRRAQTLARTEIIRAHHQAMVREYRNWQMDNVFVRSEWVTSQDTRVCDRCASLEGNIYTLAEVENLIPLHPNCRCIALPVTNEILIERSRAGR